MSVAEPFGGIGGLADFIKYSKSDAVGFNIVKFFSAFKTGASEAAKAASSSAGSISKFFQAFSGGAKAGWQAIPMLTKIGLGITAVSLAYTALLNREREAKISMQNEFDDAFSKASGGTDVFDAYKNYQAAQSAYDGSIESKNALESATLSLAAALGKEKDEIDSIKDSLQDLTAAELLESIDQAKLAVANAGNKLLSTGTGGSLSFSAANNKGYINSFAQMMMDQSEDESMYNLFAIDSQTRLEALLNVYDAMVARRKELVDSKQTDTLAYRKLNEAINYLRPDVEDLRNAQDLLSDSTERYDAVVNNTVESVEAVSEPVKSTADNLKESSESTVKAIQSIESAQKLLSSQETGKSLSPSDLSSDEMKEYASALEYVNGAYHLNAERVNELVAAKTELVVSQNEERKAMAQAEYLERAKEISKLREELVKAERANDGNADSIRNSIKDLLDKNAAIRDECAQYDLMSAALREATSAYQNWLNAKSAPNSGAMLDEAVNAANQISDILNNPESPLYRQVGSGNPVYKAAVDFIVPDSVDKTDTAAVNSYLDSISSMFNQDAAGKMTGINLDAFLRAAESAKLLVKDEVNGVYDIVEGTMVEDFTKILGDGVELSLPLVQAIFEKLRAYTDSLDFSDEVPKTLWDLSVAAVDASEKLREVTGERYQMSIDVSDIPAEEDKIAHLNKTISDMQDLIANKDEMNLDVSQVEYAKSIIEAAVEQKHLLFAPDIMMVDTSVVQGELGRAIEVLQEFQRARDSLDKAQSLGLNTAEAQANLDAAARAVQELDANLTSEKALNIDTTDIDSISKSLDALKADLIVKAGVDESAVIGYQESEHTAEGTVEWNNDTKAVDVYAAAKKYAQGTVAWYNDVSLVKAHFTATGTIQWSGNGDVNGSSNASGSAHMRGDWRTKGGRSLVGELGKFLCPLTQ